MEGNVKLYIWWPIQERGNGCTHYLLTKQRVTHWVSVEEH